MSEDEQKIKELILEVLEGGYLMSLGTSDKGGVWVADVIYVNDKDLNIYWMSSEDTRHSQAILSNPRVAGTITIGDGSGGRSIGIQFSGVAEKVEEDRLDLELAHAAKRNKPLPSKAGTILEGDSWYKLKPKIVELIYEPLFRFDKQGIELN